MEESLPVILARLKDKQTSSLELLDFYRHPYYLGVWKTYPSLYAAFARRLIGQAYPAQAMQLILGRFRELEEERPKGSAPPPVDSELTFLLALAFSRGWNLRAAERWLTPLLEVAVGRDDKLPSDMTPSLRIDIVAQRGKIDKFLSDRERDPVRKLELILRSAYWYGRAAELAERLVAASDGKLSKSLIDYPCINAATMWRLASEYDKANRAASTVVAHLSPLLEANKPTEDYWSPATLGEAYVILGKHDDAIKWYEIALLIAESKGDIGEIDAMCGNLYRLKEVGATASTEWIEKRVGALVVFSGHLIDTPRRRHAKLPDRFPDDPTLIRAVKEAIRTKLNELNATVGYSSLASGADILFAEAMLERHSAELHLIFPFSQADFVHESVDFGLDPDPRWTDWKAHYENVLRRVKKENIHFATEEPYLNTKILFDHGNRFLQGLAMLRAKERFIKPVAMVVLDELDAGAQGGTKSFLDSWTKAGLKYHTIDIAKLRPPHLLVAPLEAIPKPKPKPESKLRRSIKAMLFSDVQSYSKLAEEKLPDFIPPYFKALEGLAGETKLRRHFANTWGDGLHAVFESVKEAAEFATMMMTRMTLDMKWSEFGYKDDVPLRISLHAGPVFDVQDPFLNSPSCSGRHVNLTARIEPVTVPGCIYASEQFAALLTVDAPHDFVCERVGRQKLPKDAGECVLYRVSRR